MENLIEKGFLEKSELIALIGIRDDYQFIEELVRLSKVNLWGDLIGEQVSSRLRVRDGSELILEKRNYLEFGKFSLCILFQHISLDKNEVNMVIKEFTKVEPSMKDERTYRDSKVSTTNITKLEKQIMDNYDKNEKLPN